MRIPDRDLSLEELGSLNEEEGRRARSFGSEKRRLEFSWARWFLRSLLASALDRRPKDLVFRYGPQGKPDLEGGELRFNLSHTEGWIACSLARSPVGIDVEMIPSPQDLERVRLIARRHFSGPEREYLEGLHPSQILAAFTRIFTLKEAHMKASGVGWSLPGGGFSAPLPLRELSRAAGRECLSRVFEEEGWVLAHVAEEGPEELLYYWRYWEALLGDAGVPRIPTLQRGGV